MLLTSNGRDEFEKIITRNVMKTFNDFPQSDYYIGLKVEYLYNSIKHIGTVISTNHSTKTSDIEDENGIIYKDISWTDINKL